MPLRHPYALLLVVLAFCPALVCGCAGRSAPGSASSAAVGSEQRLVDEATALVQWFDANDPDGRLAFLLREAGGVMVFPQMAKGAFIGGMEGGRGVGLAKHGAWGWSRPAFFTFSDLSFGLQAGAMVTSAILVFQDVDTFRMAVEGQWSMGARFAWTLLNVGERGQSTVLTDDMGVVLFLRTMGAFVGSSISGGGILPSAAANAAWCGGAATARDIFRHETCTTDGGDGLRAALFAAQY